MQGEQPVYLVFSLKSRLLQGKKGLGLLRQGASCFSIHRMSSHSPILYPTFLKRAVS